MSNIEYVPLTQIAEELGYHVRHVRLLCKQGKIKAQKVGKPWIVTREAVEEFKRQPRPTPGPAKGES